MSTTPVFPLSRYKMALRRQQQYALPPLSALVRHTVKHFKQCTALALDAASSTVGLFDGSIVQASLFLFDSDACYPRTQAEIPVIGNNSTTGELTGYPLFALEGLYYPQLLQYYKVFPRVRCQCSVMPVSSVTAGPSCCFIFAQFYVMKVQSISIARVCCCLHVIHKHMQV